MDDLAAPFAGFLHIQRCAHPLLTLPQTLPLAIAILGHDLGRHRIPAHQQQIDRLALMVKHNSWTVPSYHKAQVTCCTWFTQALRGSGMSLFIGVCLLVGCLTSQQHASVSLGWDCSDNFTCCHTEKEVADQTFISPSHSILTPDQPVPALTL